MKRLSRAVRSRSLGGRPMPVVFDGLPACRRSEVTLIAGQPGAGKSLMALWLALGWIKEGLRGIYFSADSAELGQASRALAMWVQNLPATEAEQMLEQEDEWATGIMEQLNSLYWSFEDDLTYDSIDDEIQAFWELWGQAPDFVIVDNLTDVEGQSEDEWSTQRRALKALTQMARATDSATVVLHHTSEDDRIKELPCPPRKAIVGKCSQKPALIFTTADHGPRRPVAVVKDRFGKSDKSGQTATWYWLDEETLHWRRA
jgi:predicted ATP-dependent serine protease